MFILFYFRASNHGTFYFNQLAALKILVNDLPGAKLVTNTYFDTLYKAQITANGEQVSPPPFQYELIHSSLINRTY